MNIYLWKKPWAAECINLLNSAPRYSKSAEKRNDFFITSIPTSQLHEAYFASIKMVWI